ncbi:M13 family metallopeptidase [Corynebacterium ulceribovis]|uniref:M13 family metallopeptidase n=1 Tax=Corynebacterium ulceribovis TaxID=487732 RepID=UPI00035DF919|nr:M13-type metalloendopeptidase [Corynebacterium ulceribovis]
MTSSLAAALNQPAAKDDLFRAVNGRWIATHRIPADRAVDGAFYALRDAAELAVRKLIESAGPETRVGKLYGSFMDTDRIEAAGINVLIDDVQALSDLNADSFAEVLGRLDRVGVSGAAAYYITKASDSELETLYLLQSGLGLPDEAYYREEAHAETVQKYRSHVRRMLTHFLAAGGENMFALGTDVGDAAQRIVALETKLAHGHWDVVASRDAMRTYNPTDVADLPDGFDWAGWLAAAGVATERIVVMQPSFLQHFAQLVQDVPMDDWRLWALWRVLQARAAYLPDVFVQENFAFNGKVLSGQEELKPRWKRAVALCEGLIGQDIGQAYVERHFPPEAKSQIDELVSYLIDAYRERITKLPWMTDETRGRALEKLGQFRAKIGYPDKWIDYSTLQLSDDLLANVRAGNAFEHDRQVRKLGKPTDRDEWFATPQTVNAFYNPTVNDITFPAAILQYPFFDPNADMAWNFGAIGAVIGHEIGHGFDDQGSHYDGAGNLNDWWSEEDRKAFTELTDGLVAQYEGLVPAVLAAQDRTDGVNGKFTLGENIGDLGGLGIAVVAYRRWLAANGKTFADTKIIDEPGFGPTNGLQRFFLSWARVWRTTIRPEMALQYLSIDPHSPAEFRCNVVASNVAEFYEAFDVAEGDGMWLAPEDRVVIW